jgi:cephalosporin-C deacetylase-like acetyl esterase
MRSRWFFTAWLPLSLSISISFTTVFGQQAEEPEDLRVFRRWAKWNDPGSFLIGHLIAQAGRYYDLRDEAISRLKTKDDWLNRQAWVGDRIEQLLGPLPDKTPLNPRITGVLKKDGYRIEKLVYESLPGFHVAGCLFVPDDIRGKAPAILNVIGHNQAAFRAELYQLVYLNLVRKGFVVLVIDPIGQGESVQYYDPEVGFSAVGYSVLEHCYFGNISFLCGISPGRYFAWDGIRGIDYLLTRDFVDPERIGVTGFSGGGTVTSYIAALDDRVKVSVPCSWSTASRRQVETRGTQDAETVFVRGLAEGITFEDLLEVRAPKPTLLTFTSRDEYLSIQGAREAFQEARRAYRAFGREGNLEMVEDDFRHWMTPSIRLSIYAFLMKHLDVQGDPVEEEVEILPEKELQVTPTGQLSTWLNSESIFGLVRREAEGLIDRIERSRRDIKGHLTRVRSQASEISGFRPPEFESGRPFFKGGYQRDGYSVGRFAIQGEGDYRIPLLLFVPHGDGKFPAIVYLHPEGKAAEAAPGGQIEALARSGYVVAAPDVLGVGETENRVTRAMADDYTGVLIGRSTPGIQAGDIVRVVNYLRHLDNVDAEAVGAVGVDEMCIPMMHAAAFETSIKGVVLVGALLSYRSVVMNEMYRIGLRERENGDYWHPHEVDFSWGVAGALTAYDLPDLIGCMAPRRVLLAGPRDQLLESAPQALIDEDMAFPRAAYAYLEASQNLRIDSAQTDLVSLVRWSFGRGLTE